MADIGIRGFGATPAEAFEQAGLALTAVVTQLDTVRAESSVEIYCQAPDKELLLVDWLNAIVFEMAVGQMLFRRFQVTINGNSLVGRATGEKINPARHAPAAEVKGATLSELQVTCAADGRWRAQCIVDV